MSIEEPEQSCGDGAAFFMLSASERLGLEHKRLTGALDALFRAVRCESESEPESVRPEHISALVEVIVRNLRKKEPCVPWARGRAPERELDCPGCQHFMAEPLTAACGHSYCRSCLQRAGLSECKRCREELGPKHLLRANVLLCGLLEKWFPEEVRKAKRSAEVQELLRSKHLSRALALATPLLHSGQFTFTQLITLFTFSVNRPGSARPGPLRFIAFLHFYGLCCGMKPDSHCACAHRPLRYKRRTRTAHARSP